ncbi:MAG: hypothetical protein JO072_00860 [Parafilimonas sp.]|nr:hypothetical protein [Parafilimonas sp.]
MILILSLTAFFTEVSVMPFRQTNSMHCAKTDNCSKCARMPAKDACQNADKKTNEPCNKSAACFSCPLCLVFLPLNYSAAQSIQLFNKTVYSLYKDNIVSAFIPETWKPPNT